MEANTPSSVSVPSSSNLSKPPLTSKKKSRKTSDVWDHFTRNLDNPNDPMAICNYCDKSYVGGNRSSGTSTLRGHMVNQCPNNPFRIEDKKQKTLIFQKMMGGKNKSVEGANPKAVEFSQSDCRIACVKMIILDELSFRFVEQEGFKLFCSIACPKFDIPSCITVSRDIKKLYCDEKKKLKDYFIKHSQRVSLTTDTWTSIQNVCYMVLTAHFIDHEWKMQKRILNFCQISNHKGDTIGKAIETCLREWGIEMVFTITVDNASSNNVAIAHIKKRLQIWKTTVCDGDFLHMRCSAHILNLVVGDGLKEVNDSIVAVRNAVRYVRASPERLGRFQRSVNNTCKLEKASVCLDVATRWNSTYFMLDRAIKYSDAFKLLEEDDEFYMQYFIEKDRNGRSITGPPTSNDWENYAIFCRFLKLFYEATLKFSASLFVTANSYFHEMCTIRGRIMKLCDSDRLIMKDMASKMKIKFDKQADTIITSVNNSMSKLFSHYSNEFKLKNPQVSSTQCGSSIPTPDKSSMLVDSDDEDSFNMFANDFEKECEEDDAFNKKNKLEKYLEERSDGERKNKDFDILVWWKMSTSKYPVLAMMARDVLSIQVSTVASESSFSTGDMGSLMEDIEAYEDSVSEVVDLE
ncbi:hypothetical protein LXL04_033769 [Taraxacum kok-saghyz]